MKFKFGRYIQRFHANKSPLKIRENRERGRIQGLPKFLEYFIIPGSGKATNFKFGRYIHRVHPNKSPGKNFQKRERRCIQGLPKLLKYPLLSHERVKLRTSNFARTFLVSIGTKALTNFGKSSRGLVRTIEIFQGTHILGASRGRLCDGSAFLFV